MVVATKTIEVEEAIQAPLITDWPLRTDLPPIESWPVRREPPVVERVRQLVEDPCVFRDFLQVNAKLVVGQSYDGRQCPFAQFLRSELGPRLTGLYVNALQTGVMHDCSFRHCDRYTHVEHPEWLRRFITDVDTGAKGRAVRGALAVAIHDAAIAETAVRAGA